MENTTSSGQEGAATQPFGLIDAAFLAALVIAAGVFGPWLDSQPSDTDTERAGAADLHDARVAARRQQHLARAQADMHRQQHSSVRLDGMPPVPAGTVIHPRNHE